MIEKYDSKMRIKGEAWMKLGKATKKQILEKPDRHVKNLIVDICSNLLAQWALINVDNSVVASISDTTKHIPGILTLAVGTGGPGWNTQSPPVETSDLTLLFSEIARNTFASVNYVDSSGNDITTPISANVDITTSRDECQGLFAKACRASASSWHQRCRECRSGHQGVSSAVRP